MNRLFIAILLALAALVGAATKKYTYAGAYEGLYDQAKRCPVYTHYNANPKLDTSIHRLSSFWRDDTLATLADSDYNSTGYDRGHQTPAEDMAINANTMRLSFSMANVCWQAPTLNRGAWAALEKALRDSTAKHKGGSIWTGPLYRSVIAKPIHNSPIPSHYFKVYCYASKCSAWVYPNDGGSYKSASQVVPVTNLAKETKLTFK